MQENVIPQLNNKINDAYNTAHKKADAKVEKIFGSKISAQKSAAYITAAKTADAKVERIFDSKISAQKSAAYITARKTADAKVETAFNKAVNLKKQQAYKGGQLQADAAAKQAVEQKFHALFPTITDFSSYPAIHQSSCKRKGAGRSAGKSVRSTQSLRHSSRSLPHSSPRQKLQPSKRQNRLVDEKFTSMHPQLDDKACRGKGDSRAKGKAAG